MDIKKKELTKEEYARIDFTKVRKIINEYFVLKKINDKEQQKKLFNPLYRLYLKAIGKFQEKKNT